MANNGLPGHVACMSAYPPTADIRWPMSVIVLISSALPLKAGVAAVGREIPKLTHSGHSESDILYWSVFRTIENLYVLEVRYDQPNIERRS